VTAPTWLHIRTDDGVVHAFRRREDGGPRWIGACGTRLWLPEGVREPGGLVDVSESVDCMSCLVHQARQSR
jgi:hypothetical protein